MAAGNAAFCLAGRREQADARIPVGKDAALAGVLRLTGDDGLATYVGLDPGQHELVAQRSAALPKRSGALSRSSRSRPSRTPLGHPARPSSVGAQGAATPSCLLPFSAGSREWQLSSALLSGPSPAGLLEPTPGLEPGTPSSRGKDERGTRVHAGARAGAFSLETEQFLNPRSGRACPPVPELTYPFCTRPGAAGRSCGRMVAADRTQEVGGSRPPDCAAAPQMRSSVRRRCVTSCHTVWGAKNRVPPANPHFSGTRTEF